MGFVWNLRLTESSSCGLSFPINVPVEAYHSFGLVGWQSHTTRLGEGIGSCRRRHIKILPLQIMSPMRDWNLRGIVPLRYPLSQILIGSPLKTAPSSVLYHKLLIFYVDTHRNSILGLHNFASNGILAVVHFLMNGHISCLKHPLLPIHGLLHLLLRKLLFHSVKNLYWIKSVNGSLT